MKKKLIIVLVVVLLAGGGYFFYNKNKADNKAEKAANTFVNIDACAVFTETEAQEVLGEAATKGTTTGPTSSDDINVSTCTYSNNATSAANIQLATVLVRSPKNSAGVDSNKAVFGNGKPQDVEMVQGYGVEAYYNADTGQLNVLKDNAWYIISNGLSSPSDRTLEDTKAVADKTFNQ